MTIALTTDFFHRSAEDAVNVDLDLTVFGQVGLFIVLMLVLKPVLFDPMLKLYEERERRIDGAKLEAREMDAESAGALAKVDSAMERARGDANAERDKLRAEGTRTETELLTRVRREAAATLEAGRAKMASERRSIEAALDGEAKSLARELAAATLGREVRA